MAQALVVTAERNPFMDCSIGENFAIILDWTSATDGTVNLPIASTYSSQKPFGEYIQPSRIIGELRSIETAPGENGNLTDDLPTDNYNIAIKDRYGLDIAGGNLAARSGTVAEKIVSSGKLIIDSELTLIIDSAGDSKKGRIIMEFE